MEAMQLLVGCGMGEQVALTRAALTRAARGGCGMGKEAWALHGRAHAPISSTPHCVLCHPFACICAHMHTCTPVSHSTEALCCPSTLHRLIGSSSLLPVMAHEMRIINGR